MGFLFLLGIISQGLEQANLEYMSFFVFLGRCHTCNLYKTDLIWYNFRPLILRIISIGTWQDFKPSYVD
jgi:hypothetical protein